MTTNIFEACAIPDSTSLKALIRDSPDAVNQRDESGLPPLYTAALHRNAAAIEVLLNGGAEIDIFACCYLERNDDGRRLLSEDSSCAHERTPKDRTPLHFAAQKGNIQMARLLVEHGADVNAVDADRTTPLLEAAHGGPWKPDADENLITLLIDSGAQVDFHTAAAIGRADLLREAAATQDDINALDGAGQSALYHAAHNNHLACVRVLLEAGADPDRLSEDGQTPLSAASLHLLSQQCDPEICRELIRAGAAYDIHTAAALGDVAQIQTLLKEDSAHANGQRYGFRPADYAVHCGQLEALKCLLERGADPAAEDAYGNSLLDKSAHLPALHKLLTRYLRPN